jgi:hypothetical protein
MNQVKAYAQYNSGLGKHQVYVDSQVFEVMADGKKEARAIVEGWGYKVDCVTRFI